MEQLVHGVKRFREEVFPQDPQNRIDHQPPQVLFVACADAPVGPDVFTQARPGDLLIVANEGNIVPPFGSQSRSVASMLEFAVTARGVRHIVVCGHTGCSAMKRLLHPETLAGMPAMSAWLAQAEATRRIVREHYESSDEDQLVNAMVRENVLVQLNHLETHPVVVSRVACGELSLHGWVFDAEAGEVDSFDTAEQRYMPLWGCSSSRSTPVARLRRRYAFAPDQALGFEHFL